MPCLALDEVTNLEEIVVTAGRIEEQQADLTTNVTVISEERIKASSAQDLGEILASEGFYVREYPNSLTAVKIRGFSTDTYGSVDSSYVTVLVNGRPSSTSNVATIMMDNVERVEIIRGPGSVQYGSSAIGGVVNVITKEGDGKPSLFVDQTLGSWDYRKTAAGASGQVNNFDFSLSASTEEQGSYNTANGDKYNNTGFDSKDRFSANVGWTFLHGQRLGLTYTSYKGDEIGSPGYLSANDPDDSVDLSNRQVDVVYDGQTADEFLFWSLRYYNGRNEYETYDDSLRTYFMDTDQQGANAQLTAKWNIAHVTAGIDWVNYETSDTYMVSGEECSYDNPALYLLTKTKLLNDTLILSAGGRYDRFDIEGDSGDSTDATNWSTNLGAAYKINPMVSVRVNYAEGFKMPTPSQLFMYADYSAVGWGVWSGSKDLDPEESTTYEAGIDLTKDSIRASLTYFYTDFENKIGYSYNVADGITYYENGGGAEISGFEGSLQFDIGDFAGWESELIPYLSFTYLDKYEDDSTGDDLSYLASLTASYGLRFNDPGRGLSANINFAYIGEQDITDYEGTGETSLNSFTVTDLSLTKTLAKLESYGELSLKGEIRNLFDEDYAYVQGYPMPGRSFFVSLKYRY